MLKFRHWTEGKEVGNFHLKYWKKKSVLWSLRGFLQEAEECSRPFMLKSHTCIKPEALKSSCGDLVPEIFGERSDNIRLYTLFLTCLKTA